MPIKNLTETVRIPRLGKIHLGVRHPEKGYPMKTDYFVLPKDHSDYKKLVALFGEKPKELRILIPVEDEEQWATQYYKAYNLTQGLICKGDGDNAMRMVDIKTNQLPNKATETVSLVDMECVGKDCPEYKLKKCHEVMNLKFIIPEVPGLGVWQIDTGSINSILNINSCARIIKKAFGRISMVPLKLTLEPIDVNNPEDGRKQKVYVMNLRTDITMAQLADAAREQSKQFMLEGPDMEAILEEDAESLLSNEPSNSKEDKTKSPVESKVAEKKDEAEQPSEKPKTKIVRDPASVKTKNDMTKACHEDFGMSQTEWIKEAGYKSFEDISEPLSDIYAKIASIRKEHQPE